MYLVVYSSCITVPLSASGRRHYFLALPPRGNRCFAVPQTRFPSTKRACLCRALSRSLMNQDSYKLSRFLIPGGVSLRRGWIAWLDVILMTVGCILEIISRCHVACWEESGKTYTHTHWRCFGPVETIMSVNLFC